MSPSIPVKGASNQPDEIGTSGIHSAPLPKSCSSEVKNKRSGTLQPSLSGLAAQHMQKRTGINREINLSTIAVQNPLKGKVVLQHNSLATNSLVQPCLSCQCGLKEESFVSTLEPNPSHLSFGHSQKRLSLSNLAAQHAANKNTSTRLLQPSVHKNEVLPLMEVPSVPTVSTLKQHMSGVFPLIPTPNKNTGPCLSSLATQHFSKKSEGVPKSGDTTIPELLSDLKLGSANIKVKSETNLCQTSTHSARLLQSKPGTCFVPLVSKRTAGVSGISVGGVQETLKESHQSRPGILSSLRGGPAHSSDVTQPCKTQSLASGEKVAAYSCLGNSLQNVHKKLEPPPGFETLQTQTRKHSYSTVETDVPCVKCLESTSSFLSSEPTSDAPKCTYYTCACIHSHHLLPLQSEPSLFSVTLCETNMTGLKVKQVEVHVLHERTRTKMLFGFNSLAGFNFLTHSPDDTIRDKQNEGFQAHL
jgi:hypothetical protein